MSRILANTGRHSTSTGRSWHRKNYSTRAVRRSDNSDDKLRIRNMGTHQRTRRNDTIDATQNAPTQRTNIKTNEEKDTNDSSCTGDESEDGHSSITHKDQDSDVSFESDTDEEIDTWPKAATKSTKHGSTQQKTAEDGLYSKKITQWLQKKDITIMREWEEMLITDQRGTSMEWDWATKKWPTSHNTKWKDDQSKKWKNDDFWKPQQLRNQLRMQYSKCEQHTSYVTFSHVSQQTF